MMYDTYASPSNWMRFQMDWAIDLLITDYGRHLENHRKIWDLDHYIDFPEFVESLRKERQALEEVIKFWKGNRSGDKHPTPEQLELFKALAEVI